MAASSMTTDPASPPPSAQVVGNAFVQQYYHILHHSPELVFRFYQEGSKLGRPDDAGGMSHVTTTQAINEKIMSMDYGECVAEVKTVDAQESLGGGVIVLVTGCLTWKDSDKRDFTQSFFLATQDKGYFVLNDVFRYAADEAAPAHEEDDGLADGVAAPPCAPEQEPPQEEHEAEVVEQAVTAEEDCGVNEEEVCNPSDQEGLVVVEENEPVEEVINEVQSSSTVAVVDSISSVIPEVVVPEEAPKKSYASIVKVAAPLRVHVPVSRTAPVSAERRAPPPPVVTATPEVIPPTANSYESSDVQETEADGYSIYIKNLPLNATPIQLEEEFKKFGPIKPNGIQVRSQKQQGFCFAFVEFEVASAVKSAIEASPINIGGRQAYVEEKRPSGSRAAGSRGRFPLGRGGGNGIGSGFRGDGMRGRVSYGGGRGGYGRGEFNNRPDFSGRGGGGRGGPFGRGSGNETSYQWVDQMGPGGGRESRNGPLASPRSVPPHVQASA